MATLRSPSTEGSEDWCGPLGPSPRPTPDERPARRELWNELRRLPDDRWARDFKGSRWALLKNPEDLTEAQAVQLGCIRRGRGGIWRAYEMKEQFRAILGGDLTRAETAVLLHRWCTRALRSRLAPFVKVARTMRERRDLILNAVEHGISNQAGWKA